ncbi:MAG TPA: peptidase S8 [Microscillaceae bacterium]|nr:peptidase S8 [Microscillaceae bacterium]
MNNKIIRVRLVPKNNADISIKSSLEGEPLSRSIDTKSSKDKADEVLRRTKNENIEAQLTPNNAIVAELSLEQFKDVYKGNIEEISGKELVGTTRKTSSFFSSKEEITLPDHLKDLVDFAYIPSPPDFFAPTYITPRISSHYLGLTDVLRMLNGAQCHRKGVTGKDVRVAMIDSGFFDHPYFERMGYTISRKDTDFSPDANPTQDGSGHGTGESANVLVMAPDCEFIGIKNEQNSALAFELALESNAQIITNSWGWNIDYLKFDDLRNIKPNLYLESIDLRNIIKDAVNAGVNVVFAGGNGHKAFPASMPEVIAVGGVFVNYNEDLQASNYASSFKSQFFPGRTVPDFCGIVGQNGSTNTGHIMLPVPPGSELEGENIHLPGRKNLGWGIFSGTSAAAPQIAGCIALMLSIKPNLTPDQVKKILAQSAIDITKGKTAHGDAAKPGPDLATGSGLVNIHKACEIVEQML